MDLVDQWVSQEFQNLADVLYDYDRNLRLEMLPVAEQVHLIDKSKVFRVVDISTNSVVKTFDSLTQPQQILASIFMRDRNKNDPIALMDANNAATQALEINKWLEEQGARREFNEFVGKNQKSRWHHNGRVRDEHYNDLGPVRKVIE